MSIEKYAENKERERIAAIEEDRKNLLSELTEVMPMGLGQMQQEVFDNYLNGLKVVKAARIEAEQKAEAERIAKEIAEREEQERIRKENEQLKKEAEERERLAKIEAAKREKAEAERLAKEQAEQKAREDKEKKERAEFEAKLKQERETRERLEREELAKREALMNELKAKEEAEQKRSAAEQAEQLRLKKEAETKAAAPDKEKLVNYINSLSFTELNLSTEKGKIIAGVISQKFEAFKVWAIQQSQTI
jgi:membrane protein involved in colicin uptake